MNLVTLATGGEKSLVEEYIQSVEMALESCQAVGGQFKLVETPLNSFILVSNVLPEDNRPWIGKDNWEGVFDFSSLAEALEEDLVDQESVSPDTGRMYPKPTHLSREHPVPDTVRPKSGQIRAPPIAGATDEISRCGSAGPKYQVYGERAWTLALTLSKDAIINEAMEMLANPKNWVSLLPEDPLPCIWMVFHGLNSFCASSECLYRQKFGIPGPILFPSHMYTPSDDITSFLGSVCALFKILYTPQDFANPSVYHQLPFDIGRALAAVTSISCLDTDYIYVSRLCLLCHLYRQNRDINASSDLVDGVIVLGGKGRRYLSGGNNLGRDLQFGDTIIAPRYNLQWLLSDLRLDGLCQDSGC